MGLSYFVWPGFFPSVAKSQAILQLLWQLCVGTLTGLLIWRGSSLEVQPRFSSALAPILAGLISALLALVVFRGWANSGDEYGYNYVADTLLHGRFWNSPLPDTKLFKTIYIADRDGKLVSQYPPGWPLILAGFKFFSLGWFANAVLTGLMALALGRAMRLVNPDNLVTCALLAITMLSPFVVFNGASFFSHTTTGLFVSLICWMQLSDERRPKAGKALLIGFSFSMLLITRLEDFAIIGGLYGLDTLFRWNIRTVRRMAFAVLGALPITCFLLIYNWRITGNPLQLVEVWAGFPGAFGLYTHSDEGANSPLIATLRTSLWAGNLFDFSSPLMILWGGLALLARRRVLRFYDLAFPATVFFFFFFADFGGFHFGPRYWFAAWPAMALSVAAYLNDEGRGVFRNTLRQRIGRVAALQLIVYAGCAIGYTIFLQAEFSARCAIAAQRPPVLPAIVLVPNLELTLSHIQRMPLFAISEDFTRNGVDFTGREFSSSRNVKGGNVLYGIDKKALYPVACRFGRAVFIWHGPGAWQRLSCESAH